MDRRSHYRYPISGSVLIVRHTGDPRSHAKERRYVKKGTYLSIILLYLTCKLYNEKKSMKNIHFSTSGCGGPFERNRYVKTIRMAWRRLGVGNSTASRRSAYSVSIRQQVRPEIVRYNVESLINHGTRDCWCGNLYIFLIQIRPIFRCQRKPSCWISMQPRSY